MLLIHCPAGSLKRPDYNDCRYTGIMQLQAKYWSRGRTRECRTAMFCLIQAAVMVSFRMWTKAVGGCRPK